MVGEVGCLSLDSYVLHRGSRDRYLKWLSIVLSLPCPFYFLLSFLHPPPFFCLPSFCLLPPSFLLFLAFFFFFFFTFQKTTAFQPLKGLDWSYSFLKGKKKKKKKNGGMWNLALVGTTGSSSAAFFLHQLIPCCWYSNLITLYKWFLYMKIKFFTKNVCF